MKRKMLVVGLLVLVCLSVLVVEGVSQPVPPERVGSGPPPISPTTSPAIPPPTVAVPPPTVTVPEPNPNFSVVQAQQPEWTFEQLVEALKGVRARQKELQKQEADLLAKIAAKVEEKRQDLSKSEATLHQLRNENGHVFPPKATEWRKEERKMEKKGSVSIPPS